MNFLEQLPFFQGNDSSSAIHTDIHAHLLPGVDDGPKTMEESAALISGLVALGYKKLYATAHVYQEFYPNQSKGLLDKYAELKAYLKAQNIEVDLYCAAEYFLDETFLDLLEKKDLLFVEDNYLLVEDSFLERRDLVENYIFKIRTKGYKPILAHPERYKHLAKNLERCSKLKKMGCFFQVNILSLIGHYGPEAKKAAEVFLKKGYVEFLGTDLHHKRHLKLLEKFKQTNKYRRLLSRYSLRNNLLNC